MDIDWWFLCQPSENRDDRKVGALFSAVRSNDVEKVQLGLTKGVPVDCVDEVRGRALEPGPAGGPSGCTSGN